MDKENAKGAAEFEPPKYLASLIAAINDGAKAAQGGALAFLLVGIYLLASAFSSSDEDLLLGKTVTISQIGASLPVSFSFAIAPLVFVFVHLYTLARYDMVAVNARHFVSKLRQDVPTETDRENCRQLLANVEFLAVLTAPRGSALYSRFWPWLFRGIVVVFPIAVLLLVQVNALRYQSDLIMWVQRATLALDLAALTWFFARNPFYAGETKDLPVRWRRAVRRGMLVGLPALVLLFNFAWLSTASPGANPDLVRFDPGVWFATHRGGLSFFDLFRQPLDMLACLELKWGCRFLRVDHRTLIGKVWDDKAIAELRTGAADRAKVLPSLEGVVLRGRSLRFAVLDESRLYAADMTNADLRNASLGDADISGARLKGAKLHGSNITGNQLSSASRDLSFANLSGLNLRKVQLRGANLAFAQLQGADLSEAQLQGAHLFKANLQGANLAFAQLQGADLSEAQLQGADLTQAQLQGAELRLARLWNVHSTEPANFSLGDMRYADFHTAPRDWERGNLRQILEALGGDAKLKAEKQLKRALADEPLGGFDFVASRERPVLVSYLSQPALARHPDWLITEPTPPYTGALVDYLASELASTDPYIAAGIANNILSEHTEAELLAASPDVSIACRLLSETKAGQVSLEQSLVDRLSRSLKDAKRDCPATN
jgi:uncharacterized protein YjbI with pentapeptide repeats